MKKEELLKWATSKKYEMCIWDEEIIVGDGNNYVSLDVEEANNMSFKQITRLFENELRK